MFGKLRGFRQFLIPYSGTRSKITKLSAPLNVVNSSFTQQIKYFSNEALKEAFLKVKRDREAAAAAAAAAASGGSKAEVETPEKPVGAEEIKHDAEKIDDAKKEEPKGDDAKKEEPKGDAASTINIEELRFKAFAFVRDAKVAVEVNLKAAWGEMTGSSRASVLEKKFEQSQSFRRARNDDDDHDSDQPASNPGGPSALVVVPADKSYWERMEQRLDGPIIREILRGAKRYGKAVADTDVGKQAQKVTQSMKDKIDDAREFWETSQNPIVHTLSGVWENMTGDTEEGLTISEIRKKDPEFIKETWTEEVRMNVAPIVIKAHLMGDTKTLKLWMTEGVYSRLAADIRARKADGIVIDANILAIDENTVIMRFIEGGGPVILVVYMVQQINCIRNKAGDIIEGAESQIKAKFYSLAFQQVYEEIDGDENNAILKWKIVDYQLAGEVPYY